MVRHYFFSWVALVAITIQLTCAVASGEEPDSKSPDSTETKTNLLEIVNKALEAEAAGDLEKRKKLLNQVIDQQDSAPARWQSGYLSSGKKSFETVAESTQANEKNLKLSTYRQKRKSLAQTAAGHWEMANWCAKEKLMPQARAHLNRVIDFEPDHAKARGLLGFRRMGNEWVSPEELEVLSRRAAAKSVSLQKYGKQISKLIEQMNSSRPKIRDRAIASLMKLTEPDAVGAVENGLASAAVPASKLAVDWMSQIDTVESSHVLVRYSLLHPNDEIRQYATAKLVGRPLHDYVPELLDMLSSPIRTAVVPAYDRDGFLLGYRQSFSKEGFDNKDVAIITQTNIMPERSAADDRRLFQTSGRRERFNRIIQQQENQRVIAQLNQQAEAEVAERVERMNRENLEIQNRNARIATVIADVLEQPFTEKPDEMWKWWDRYNETEYQEYKPERYTTEGYTAVATGYVNLSCECFVAGTQVMTELGLRNIESIVAGDQILSRDLVTGELGWKPVLQRTIRPTTDTVKIATSEDTFHCTGGHLFWVSGEGWKKASELSKGDVLHGAEKPSLVTRVKADVPLETFNLRIADNYNYFVGKAMVMTHDVTPRRPNRQKVPGQDLLKSMVKN